MQLINSEDVDNKSVFFFPLAKLRLIQMFQIIFIHSKTELKVSIVSMPFGTMDPRSI